MVKGGFCVQCKGGYRMMDKGGYFHAGKGGFICRVRKGVYALANQQGEV